MPFHLALLHEFWYNMIKEESRLNCFYTHSFITIAFRRDIKHTRNLFLNTSNMNPSLNTIDFGLY